MGAKRQIICDSLGNKKERIIFWDDEKEERTKSTSAKNQFRKDFKESEEYLKTIYENGSHPFCDVYKTCMFSQCPYGTNYSNELLRFLDIEI